jgi:hypothetical protein
MKYDSKKMANGETLKHLIEKFPFLKRSFSFLVNPAMPTMTAGVHKSNKNLTVENAYLHEIR